MDDIAPNLIQAIAHPLRLRIMAALDGPPVSVRALAERVGADRRTVSRHLQALQRVGLVSRTNAVGGDVYEPGPGPRLSDDEWGELPRVVRESAIGAALAWLHTTVTAAVQDGGFDRDDIHFSRTPLRLTEAEWEEVSAEFAALLERIEARERAAEESDDERPIDATAVLMLFERPRATAEVLHQDAHPIAGFSMADGVTHAKDLSDRLQRMLAKPVPDWPAVMRLGDQLRVVARAALARELETMPAPPIEPAHRTRAATPDGAPDPSLDWAEARVARARRVLDELRGP